MKEKWGGGNEKRGWRQEEAGMVAPSASDMPLSDSVLGAENGWGAPRKVVRAPKSGKEARGGWRALRGRKGKWRKGNMPDSRAWRAEGKILAMTAFAGVRFLYSVLCWRRSAPPIRDRRAAPQRHSKLATQHQIQMFLKFKNLKTPQNVHPKRCLYLQAKRFRGQNVLRRSRLSVALGRIHLVSERFDHQNVLKRSFCL